MLTYDIEMRGKRPLYEFFYEMIRDDIVSGRIKPGEKLPSKREMARHHYVSVITIENAYEQLLVEGYIYSVEKKGYYADKSFSKMQSKAKAKDSDIEVKNKEPEGEDVIANFTSSGIRYDNFPFGAWAKLMRKTLLDVENDFLNPPPHEGELRLRKAIARHLESFRGLSVDPENIVVGAGMEYLYSIAAMLIGKDRVIALEDPGYKKTAKVYKDNGLSCIFIPMDSEGIRSDLLENTKAGAVHISPSHQFPTGIVMPAGRRNELIRWANETESFIIEDDYDSEFRLSGKPIPAIAAKDTQHVIYMNTFSKTLAPSIRIAYMVLPTKLKRIYDDKLGYYSGTVSGFEQQTLAAFIEEGYLERHINRMKKYYRDYRDSIIKIMNDTWDKGLFEILEKDSGLHFILKINKDIDDRYLRERLLERGVVISLVSDYCRHENDNYRHMFVVNYSAVMTDDFEKALKIMLEEIKNA